MWYKRRQIAKNIAWKYLGSWYKWGGDDPSGFDCSGLVIEILKSVGILPRRYDARAEQLSYKFKRVNRPYLGCLVFYGSPITHVEFCLDKKLSIGASGGGRKTLEIKDAIRDNAFIKIRPIIRDASTLKYVDPFLE